MDRTTKAASADVMKGEVEVVLEGRGLSKAFPGVRALENVDWAVRAGTVHAILGENGAGKSTLMKILAGLHEPDAGQILFRGRPVRIRTPHQALKLGIAMIHQELMPFPELTVAENIFMGHEPAGLFLGWIDRSRMRRQARALLERLRVSVAVDRKMGDLSVAEMQMVEIARALAHRAEIIIMDEPTSAIGDREIRVLFEIIGDLKRRGVAIVYISHKLDEVLALADHVTVLRDGRRVAALPADGLDPAWLIKLMVGRDLAQASKPPCASFGRAALRVLGLGKRTAFHNVSFSVRPGEILGLAGLMGAGRTELAEAIFGLAPPDTGAIFVRDRKVSILNPASAIRHGIGLVGEDRQKSGLVPQASVKANLTLANLRSCCWGPFILDRDENRVAAEKIAEFRIRTTGFDQTVRELSGGNQQKVVIARTLLARPEILILDEPTRGIDIAAKAEVHQLILRLAAGGKAIVLISSEMPEILALSDRILVLSAGRVAAELDRREASPELILKHAMSGQSRLEPHTGPASSEPNETNGLWS